jgi:hypothetical protein
MDVNQTRATLLGRNAARGAVTVGRRAILAWVRWLVSEYSRHAEGKNRLMMSANVARNPVQCCLLILFDWDDHAAGEQADTISEWSADP